jgi:hypothetical protein
VNGVWVLDVIGGRPGCGADYDRYGPDACCQGLVWREKFPGDHLCVRPVVRDMCRAGRC